MERRSKRKAESITLEDAQKEYDLKKLAYKNCCDIVEFHRALLMDSNYSDNKLAQESLRLMENLASSRKEDLDASSIRLDGIAASVAQLKKQLADLIGNTSSLDKGVKSKSKPVTVIASGVPSTPRSSTQADSEPSPQPSLTPIAESVQSYSAPIEYFGPFVGYSINRFYTDVESGSSYFVPIDSSNRRLQLQMTLIPVFTNKKLKAPFRGPAPILDILGSRSMYVPVMFGSTVVHAARTCLPLHVGNSPVSPGGTMEHELDFFEPLDFGELPPME